jgi:signal transduction histidine kinase/CheY-like chemotaxis protein
MATSLLALVPINLLLGDGRVAMTITAVTNALFLGAMLHFRAPLVVHATVVIGGFLVLGTIGYVNLAYLAAPAMSFALAIAVSGLLLGRRAMFGTIGIVCALLVVIGGGIVLGHLPPPSIDNTSPLLAANWVRTSSVTVLFFVIQGSTLLWVVENIEGALSRARSEAERRAAAEALAAEAQRREMMGRVAGALAHDVNNNLTVITMSMPSLLPVRSDGSSMTDAARALACADIDTAVAQASALTQQLLVLGRRGLHAPRAISLRTFVDEQRGTLRRLLPSDIELELKTGSAPDPCALVDEGQLHQVLLNLVINARDAMPSGGRVSIATEIRTTTTAEPRVRGVIPAGRYAVLSVIDNGTGIDEKTRAQIFEPFFTTKSLGKGTGLGLATVLAIAEQNQGDLRVETTEGHGSAFELWLPAVDGATSVETRPKERSAQSLHGLRVLLCEDSEPVLKIADRVLSRAGCLVTTARDGSHALERLDAVDATFDLLVTDVVMPGTPVRVVIERFQRQFPGRPILLCSGYVGEELVQRGIEEGRYRLLSKPYGPEKLVGEVTRVLDGVSVV